tara:strand:- start:120 stop:371 length:252 start_codon:yes stop_codon:yes gene_type:complete
MNTKTIARTSLAVGHIVHFHGARFEITSTKLLPDCSFGIDSDDLIIVANGQWIDGQEVAGYFGKGADWTFQGNQFATADIEVA